MDATIRGHQDAGVQACAKHFIGNEQETQRSNVISSGGVNVEAISSNIDDRTLHELYLWPFANSVKAGVSSMMCSYNRVNQTYTCENSKLLNGILKEELDFQGYVMSDFLAVHSGVASIQGGLDMNMPGPIDARSLVPSSYFGGNVTIAVTNGSLSEARVDDMIRRIMTPYFHLGQDKDFPTVDPTSLYALSSIYGVLRNTIGVPPARDVRGNHGQLVRQISGAGTALLKNVNGTLPLQRPKNIGVFGNDAADVSAGLMYPGTRSSDPEFGFDIGTLTVGGGSGTGRNPYILSPFSALRERADQIGARFEYLMDNDIIVADDFVSIFPTPDVCIVFLKTFAREGSDRRFFDNDWNATQVVERVAYHCPNTVVVTHSGGVNTMPWAENPNVTAILAAHYPGQESGNAIVDVLFGDVNPSGHLPYTIPRTAADYDIPIVNITGDAALNFSAWQADFTEGLMIDYRHFDTKNITPLYEFGYGLSYTTFQITAPLTVSRKIEGLTAFPSNGRAIQPGGHPELWEEVMILSTKVENTGKVTGAQVVQLYMTLEKDNVPAGTPERVLRGFEKVDLEPTASATISFSILRRDISFWNVTAQQWQVPEGEILFSVGFSSRDINEAVKVTVL